MWIHAWSIYVDTCLAGMFYHQEGSVVSLYVSRSSYHLKRADSVSYSGMSISELLASRGGALKLGKPQQPQV